MKRALALLLALVFLFALGGCRRTDGLVDANASAAPTEEPPIVPLHATPRPAEAAQTAQVATAMPVSIDAPDITETPAITEAPVVTEAPVATEAPAVTEAPVATEAPAVTEVPTIVSSYRYTSISNETIKVRFAYPDNWTSSPSTDTITFVEPVADGDVPARISVTSFTYPEAKVSTKRLKAHLQEYLLRVLDEYNDYRLGSVEKESFVGSSGLSVTYIAVNGDAYVMGYIAIGYAKNGRVYAMHFTCSETDFDTFQPLYEALAANVEALE